MFGEGGPKREGRPVQLVIEENAFANCKNLEQVMFDPGSGVEEIQSMAFHRAGLVSFCPALAA